MIAELLLQLPLAAAGVWGFSSSKTGFWWGEVGSESVSFKLLLWGASVSKYSGKPIAKCGHGPWAALSRDRSRLHLPKEVWFQFLPWYLQFRAARSGQKCQVWGAVGHVWSQLYLHQSSAQLEQQADVLERAGASETPQRQQFPNLIGKRKIW